MRIVGIGITGLLVLANCQPEQGDTNIDKSSLINSRESVKDIDGNIYTTIMIGTQVWTAENLRVTRYSDGRKIPRVENDEEWRNLVIGALCTPAFERNSEDEAYGHLYNFFAVSDRGGLCPDGWHIPSADDWRELIVYLGGVDVAGGKMKATRSNSWRIMVQGTNNESGFTALPAGGRGQTGSAGEFGYYATWWSSTLEDSLYAWHWGLYPDKQGIRANPGHVNSGFSVRCIKDSSGP